MKNLGWYKTCMYFTIHFFCSRVWCSPEAIGQFISLIMFKIYFLAITIVGLLRMCFFSLRFLKMKHHWRVGRVVAWLRNWLTAWHWKWKSARFSGQHTSDSNRHKISEQNRSLATRWTSCKLSSKLIMSRGSEGSVIQASYLNDTIILWNKNQKCLHATVRRHAENKGATVLWSSS